MRRRTVLKAALGGTGAVAAGTGGTLGWWWAAAGTDTAGAVEFDRRLPIPPPAKAHHDAGGRKVFHLRAAPGSHRLRPGRPTATWGVNGAYLGPTLRAARGETVRVHVRNGLREATSLHWHGMHLPARMDGGPHQPVEPGGTWSPTWTVDQPAATLWYHPHPHGGTARHVYRGLAGLFLLDDPEAEPTGPGGASLPSRYGVDDIPVIVQDKHLDEDNQLVESHPLTSEVGVLGDVILVNGVTGPYLPAGTERVRLRLLNASNARIYRFGFADDRPFTLVGTDGGLLPAPHRTTRVQLSPAERAEIVVTLRPGQRAVLRSFPPDLGLNVWDRRFAGGDDTLDILEIRPNRTLEPSPRLPDELAAAPALADRDTPVDRRFALNGFAINGKSMDMRRIDFAATRGVTEIWEVTATDGAQHNFHVHDVQFQVLSVDGEPPPPELAGWKDTVHTRPGVPLRLAMRFDDHSDAAVPYMYHCHVLYHEDRGLMGQFVVVEPGQEPGGPGTESGDGHGRH
ncbi:multicopper oxidase domain-containing protein [Streptomyces sp. ICN441]|uniref:multicopper oxidase family protein n=1 Tax=Streptomyces sp. ICN441 TaxID=2558286 RepID=UPI001F1078DA|nr:multicopper oxidase domain-containing protein [Streptomyces sp. ICN441]